MPAVSTIISCPAGQWTSIAQRMDRRTSLLVQCPELATTTIWTAPIVLAGVGTQLVGANPLRRSLMMSSGFGTRRIKVGPSNAVSAQSGILISDNAADNSVQPVLQVDDSWGEWAQSAWWAWNDGAGNDTVSCFQEVLLCAGLVLAITTAPPTYTGPYGSVAPGIWIAPDLSGGPAKFSLSEQFDGDLVFQEWFAWPVGSGSVNVQVYEAFNLPPDSVTNITVQIPALSPHGKQAAIELLAKMQEGKNGYRATDNEEF